MSFSCRCTSCDSFSTCMNNSFMFIFCVAVKMVSSVLLTLIQQYRRSTHKEITKRLTHICLPCFNYMRKDFLQSEKDAVLYLCMFRLCTIQYSSSCSMLYPSPPPDYLCDLQIAYGTTENSPVTFMPHPRDTMERRTHNCGYIMDHTQVILKKTTTTVRHHFIPNKSLKSGGACL